MEKDQCHPSLRGGRRETKYSHGFSSSELEALTGICEAFIPPLPLNNSPDIVGKDGKTKAAIQSFYKSSGAQYPIPDEVIKNCQSILRRKTQ